MTSPLPLPPPGGREKTPGWSSPSRSTRVISLAAAGPAAARAAGPEVVLPLGTVITQVRAGARHALALTATGRVLAWGDNREGQLGAGAGPGSATPVEVSLPAGETVAAIEAGCFHSLALTSSGRVLAWGRNLFGQLGDGTTGDRMTPVPVRLPAGARVRAIAAGGNHSLALASSGQVFAWGLNLFGQLGDGSTGDRTVPVQAGLPGGVTVTGVTATESGSLALTGDGQVLAWGANGDGQLGGGSQAEWSATAVTAALPAGTTVRALAGGGFHVLALTCTGQMLAWGNGECGQLGYGAWLSSDVPVAVLLPGAATVTAVAAGAEHGLALTIAGEVLAWGRGAGWAPGGAIAYSNVPARVRPPEGVTVTALGAGPGAEAGLTVAREPRRDPAVAGLRWVARTPVTG
jgi:alpha-tubulin suppressor-like RCC1 family protein